MGEQQSRLHRTFVELRRRHVVRVTGAYAILAWGALEVLDIVLPALQVPHWVLTLLVVLAAIGLPIVAAVTWIYDITPAGGPTRRKAKAASTFTGAGAGWTT